MSKKPSFSTHVTRFLQNQVTFALSQSIPLYNWSYHQYSIPVF